VCSATWSHFSLNAELHQITSSGFSLKYLLRIWPHGSTSPYIFVWHRTDSATGNVNTAPQNGEITGFAASLFTRVLPLALVAPGGIPGIAEAKNFTPKR
jgi:hypothetical protein